MDGHDHAFDDAIDVPGADGEFVMYPDAVVRYWDRNPLCSAERHVKHIGDRMRTKRAVARAHGVVCNRPGRHTVRARTEVHPPMGRPDSTYE